MFKKTTPLEQNIRKGIAKDKSKIQMFNQELMIWYFWNEKRLFTKPKWKGTLKNKVKTVSIKRVELFNTVIISHYTKNI